MLALGLRIPLFKSHGSTFYFFLILFFYLDRKTTSRRAGLSAIVEFLVLNILLIFLEIGPSEIILRVISLDNGVKYIGLLHRFYSTLLE